MASIAITARLSAVVALAAMCAAVAAQVRLTPEQASARRPRDFLPAHMGEDVMVRGRVNSRAIRVQEHYDHIGIEHAGHGLMLEAAGPDLQPLRPGDDVEVAGRIGARAGLPVLQVASVRVLGRAAAPRPVDVGIEDLQGFRYLGLAVATEGRVVEVGENTAGAYMLIGPAESPYKLFVPHSQQRGASFAGFGVGDTVRAAGLASQYCPGAPFNRWYQLTVAQSGDVVRTGHPLAISPAAAVAFLAAAALFGLVWWTRERRLRAQRESLRRSHQLGEEILGASSAEDIFRKAMAVVPGVFGITRVELYVYNGGTKMLDKVTETDDEQPVSISLAAPGGGTHAGVAACFQNRMTLAVPDTSRSPFPPPGPSAPRMPRAVLFVPMLAQGEAVGVFEINHQDRARDFSASEQALAQHLGNQIGVALKLLDQRSVREQLFRTEKLAAVGRLISSVVNELQAPLSSICNLAEVALASQRDMRPSEHLKAMCVEARKASDMVSRLVSFASTESVEARALDLNNLLRRLAEFREREWKARGIRVRLVMADEPLPVLGSEGQLEQVLLDLIVHAEQALSEAPEKLITVRTLRLAHKSLIEITYSGKRGEEPPAGDAATLGLGVCRSIAAGHGGELRAFHDPAADPRFEIELPCASRERPAAAARGQEARDPGQPVTALVIEPDEAVERHLLALMSARGYRVVPVHNSDSGLDLAQRLRFDVAFCSVRAPGLNWVELSESLQSRVGGFVLLSDGYDPELAADFEGEGRFVIAKPIDENHLDRVLRRVESTLKPRAAVG